MGPRVAVSCLIVPQLKKERRLNNDSSVVLTSNSFAIRLIIVNLNIINVVLRDVSFPLHPPLAKFVINLTTTLNVYLYQSTLVTFLEYFKVKV
jgi:hypothetical protein